MKKLMIVAAVVLAASFANAASVNWSGSAVTRTGVTTAPTSWTVVLMDSALTSQATLTAAFTAGVAADITSAITAGTVLTTTGITVNDSNARWSISGGALPSSYVQNDNVTFYTLILDQSVPEEGTANYFLSQEKAGTVSDSTNLAMCFLSQSGKSWTSYTTSSTTPVPEPTSGILLLLGMAGLALRRKQK